MKKILCSIAVLLAATSSNADETKTVESNVRTTLLSVNFCSDYDTVMNELITNYGETLLFYSKGITTWESGDGTQTGESISDSQIFVNQSTGTWSLVQVFGDGMTCYTAGGWDFEPYVK